MTELCSDSMKTKKKKKPIGERNPCGRRKQKEKQSICKGHILTELQQVVNVKGRAFKTLKRIYKINKINIIIKETVKHKMQLKVQILRRYEKGTSFTAKMFKRDVKMLNREIGKETITVDDATSIEEVVDFWKNIQSEENGFDEQAEWMKHTEEINENKQYQEWNKINKDELELY